MCMFVYSVSVCMCVCMRVCVRVCVCVAQQCLLTLSATAKVKDEQEARAGQIIKTMAAIIYKRLIRWVGPFIM